MPRRREVPKREILPDPKFGSVDLSKFMNVVMESGKKAVAERIIYGAIDRIGSFIRARTAADPVPLSAARNLLKRDAPRVEPEPTSSPSGES